MQPKHRSHTIVYNLVPSQTLSYPLHHTLTLTLTLALTLAKGGFGETDAPPPPPSSGAEPEDLLTQRIRALLDAEEKAKAEGKPLPGESQ